MTTSVVGEDGKLQESRRFSSALARARDNKPGLVVEHELDMERQAYRRPAAALIRLREFIRWLTPQAGLVGPPMRSVAREIEERFPSYER